MNKNQRAERIESIQEADLLRPKPLCNVVLTKHNQPRNKFQRLLDKSIMSCLGPSFHSVMSTLNIRVNYLEAERNLCFLRASVSMKRTIYFPDKVKTSHDPDGTPVIIIGDKSQPYFRCIRIEPITETP